MVGLTKRLYRNSKKVRKSKRSISLGKNKNGGSRRIKGRKLRNSRRRRKYKRNFRSKRRGGGEAEKKYVTNIESPPGFFNVDQGPDGSITIEISPEIKVVPFYSKYGDNNPKEDKSEVKGYCRSKEDFINKINPVEGGVDDKETDLFWDRRLTVGPRNSGSISSDYYTPKIIAPKGHEKVWATLSRKEKNEILLNKDFRVKFEKKTTDPEAKAEAEVEAEADAAMAEEEEKKCNKEDVLITLDKDYMPIFLKEATCKILESYPNSSKTVKINELKKMQDLIGKELEVNNEVYEINGKQLKAQNIDGKEIDKTKKMITVNGIELTAGAGSIDEYIGKELKEYKITGDGFNNGTEYTLNKEEESINNLLTELEKFKGYDLKIELVFPTTTQNSTKTSNKTSNETAPTEPKTAPTEPETAPTEPESPIISNAARDSDIDF